MPPSGRTALPARRLSCCYGYTVRPNCSFGAPSSVRCTRRPWDIEAAGSIKGGAPRKGIHLSMSPTQTLAERPTRVRHWVIVFAVTLAAVTYIDRVAISFAAPSIRRELSLTAVQMGWVFAAFNWAYAMFEIPGGYLGDWIGPRKVLMRIVLWWSTFTAATGWAWSFPALLGTRFLFGAGEAGCFPNVAKVFTTAASRTQN